MTTGHQASDAIILSGRLKNRIVYEYDADVCTDDDYEQGRIDGVQSFYIVYSTPQYGEGDPSTQSVIVDSQHNVKFGFKVRSAQGWDKKGITLMEHFNYRGTGVTFSNTEVDVTSSFPTGQSQGVSSFIVMRGVWALYTGKNSGGTRIRINGVSEFGPGYQTESLGAVNDLIQSIECLRDD